MKVKHRLPVIVDPAVARCFLPVLLDRNNSYTFVRLWYAKISLPTFGRKPHFIFS